MHEQATWGSTSQDGRLAVAIAEPFASEGSLRPTCAGHVTSRTRPTASPCAARLADSLALARSVHRRCGYDLQSLRPLPQYARRGVGRTHADRAASPRGVQESVREPSVGHRSASCWSARRVSQGRVRYRRGSEQAHPDNHSKQSHPEVGPQNSSGWWVKLWIAATTRGEM